MGYSQDLEWLRSPGQVDVPASGAANSIWPLPVAGNWAHCSTIEVLAAAG
jgi:hypothetical protein